MNIFLTGVSGYFGGVLAECLAQAQEVESITGIDVAAPKTPLPAKVKFVQMDIRSPQISALMAGHEIVVHTAFIVLWRAKMPAAVRDDINLNGVRNIAQAAAANRVQRFIHTSSAAAYDLDLAKGKSNITEELPTNKVNPAFYYSAGKAAAERTLTEVLSPTDTCLTFFRPPFIMGPRNLDTVKSFRESAVRFPGLNPRAQFVHEDDVAAAFLQAVRADMPGAYNVAPDDSIRMSETYETIGVQSVMTMPLWLARMITDIRWRYFGQATHASWLIAQLLDCTISNAKLKGTGWKPRYLCADALRSGMGGKQAGARGNGHG